MHRTGGPGTAEGPLGSGSSASRGALPGACAREPRRRRPRQGPSPRMRIIVQCPRAPLWSARASSRACESSALARQTGRWVRGLSPRVRIIGHRPRRRPRRPRPLPPPRSRIIGPRSAASASLRRAPPRACESSAGPLLGETGSKRPHPRVRTASTHLRRDQHGPHPIPARANDDPVAGQTGTGLPVRTNPPPRPARPRPLGAFPAGASHWRRRRPHRGRASRTLGRGR